MNFIKNGKTEYSVLLPKKSTPCNEYAFEELKRFTEMATGVMLVATDEVTVGKKYFSIGKTSLFEREKADLSDEGYAKDGFTLKTDADGNIVTVAKTERGYLYAVYEFLEQVIGIRFLAPDETVIPKNRDIEVNALNFTSFPVFGLRTFLNYPTYPTGADFDYASRSRTLHNWFDFDEKYGGAPPLFSRKYRTHNARFFVPSEKYGTPESTGYSGRYLTVEEGYDPHPEFYHSAEGHTPHWESGAFGPTIDWTNGIADDGTLDESMSVSVAKIVIEEMKKDILANPTAEYFQLDQEDCVDPVTDRSLIEKYRASGVVIRFCNVVARELQKWADETLNGRKIKLVTFAYQQTMEAPVRQTEDGRYIPLDPTVLPADNLYIRLAYMSFNYLPYGDERQPKVSLEISKSWAAVCKHFWFWGYDSNFNDYIPYNATLTQIEGTCRYMHEMGVEYFIMLSSYNEKCDWQASMKQYIWMKLLWNDTLNAESLRKEYLQGYYRSVWKYVDAMVDLFETRLAEVVAALEVGHDEYNCYHEMVLPKNIGAELLEKAVEIIEEGEAQLQTDERISDEERTLLEQRLSAVKLTPLWSLLKHFREYYPSADRACEIELMKRIKKVWKQSGMIFMTEGETVEQHLTDLYGESFINA